MITNWISFQTKFKTYAKTPGLFTLYNTESLPYFQLEAFLDKCNSINKYSLTQTEMLVALSTFIDIQEMDGFLNFDIFPRKIVLILRSLIEKNLIQLHPFSKIKKSCLNFMKFQQVSMAAAA